MSFSRFALDPPGIFGRAKGGRRGFISASGEAGLYIGEAGGRLVDEGRFVDEDRVVYEGRFVVEGRLVYEDGDVNGGRIVVAGRLVYEAGYAVTSIVVQRPDLRNLTKADLFEARE